MNTIYNILATSKLVQHNNNHIPYYNNETRDKLENCNNHLTKATSSKDKDDWRHFIYFRNFIDKEIKILKTEYIREKMTDSTNNWKFLKKILNIVKLGPQTNLLSTLILSITQLNWLILQIIFLFQKFENIRRGFTPENTTPMAILEILIPKCTAKFHIPEILLEETISIIDKLPSTNSVGHDDINNNLLKKIQHKIVPYIRYLINLIIGTKIYPMIYKLTQILPLSKPLTDPNFIENLRPPCNLCCVEIIIETYILHHLEK